MRKKLLVLCSVTAILLFSLNVHASNILQNGSFEDALNYWTIGGTNTGYPPAVIVTDGSTGSAFGEAIPADTIVGGSPDPAGTYGVYFVDDYSFQSLTQSVFLDVGSYEIGFDVYLPRNGYNNPGDATFDGAIASITLADFTVKGDVLPITEWVHFDGLASVTTAGVYEADFNFETFGGASADVVIDRVYIIESDEPGGIPINAIPEPATMLLFGFGLLGLTGVSRRKK